MDKEARKELYKGKVYPGWWSILDKYVPELQASNPECDLYIKEKFGLLRLSVIGLLDDSQKATEIEMAAERASSTVCEFCGRPGVLRTDRSWRQTLCERCAKADYQTMMRIIDEAEQQWLLEG